MASLLDVPEELAKNPLLAGVNRKRLEWLAVVGREVSYRARRQVIREGDPPSAFFLLSGAVRVFHRQGRREVLVRLFRAPAGGCEMEVFAETPFTVNVTTLEPSVVLHVAADAYLSVVRDIPGVMEAMARDLAIRLVRTTLNERSLAFSRMDVRLAQVFVDYARVSGATEDGTTRLDVRLTQDGLARDLGVSRKSIGRALSVLKREGMIARESARFVIRDMVKLEALAGNPIGTYHRPGAGLA